MNRHVFFKIYRTLQPILAPGLQYSQSIYEAVLTDLCSNADTWLDLGCGHHLLPPWRLEQEKVLVSKAALIVGIDYNYASLTKHKTITTTLRGDISKLPFPDNTFDVITSNMVVEHLDNPEEQVAEISRVLTKGGTLIVHTPNTFGYATVLARMVPQSIRNKLVYILEGREAEDVFPGYYKINSPSKLRKIAQASGLKVARIKMICSSAVFVMLPPIVVVELIWIRFLMSRMGKYWRTNIIAILEKP